jgi:hypothetical protein
MISVASTCVAWSRLYDGSEQYPDACGYPHRQRTPERDPYCAWDDTCAARARGRLGPDEGGTLHALKAIRAELIDPTIAAHNGRLVKTTGDGLLVEFVSVVGALRCATEVQAGMAERNATVAADKRIEFRIGINMGDVVVEGGDIFGDGVNVAARLEAQAEPGGICVSARVQEDAVGKLDLTFEDMGEQTLKNIARPIRAYRIATGAVSATAQWTPALALPDKPSIAVLPFTNLSADPEQEYFADGTAEDIIACSWLAPISLSPMNQGARCKSRRLWPVTRPGGEGL